jgi:hypothetical protein
MLGRFWYYDDAKARDEIGHHSRPTMETFSDAVRSYAERGIVPIPPALRSELSERVGEEP